MQRKVDELLLQLERDMPRLQNDLRRFVELFEERALQICALEDSERVRLRLNRMLRNVGVY